MIIHEVEQPVDLSTIVRVVLLEIIDALRPLNLVVEGKTDYPIRYTTEDRRLNWIASLVMRNPGYKMLMVRVEIFPWILTVTESLGAVSDPIVTHYSFDDPQSIKAVIEHVKSAVTKLDVNTVYATMG